MMMVKKLIEQWGNSFSVKKQAITYAENRRILYNEAPINLALFLERLNQSEFLNNDDLNQFFSELAFLEKNNQALHDLIIGLVKAMAVNYYLSIEPAMSNLIQQLETTIQQGLPLPVLNDQAGQRYLPLLNYLVLTRDPRLQLINNTWGMDFPELTPYANQIVQYDMVFAFNTLALCHAFLNLSPYQHWNLTKPILPPGFKKTTKNMANRKDYYPYKKVFKIHEGQVGDTFFYATNGRKILCTKLQSRRHFHPDQGNNLSSPT